MTNTKDSIDWIGANEASMRNYEEERRETQKHARSIFEIMIDNRAEEEYRKMKDKKKPETDLIIDRIERSKKSEQPNCMPSADWIREKLGVSKRFASRLGEYCDPDGVEKAVKEYRKKKGLPEDIPLSQEIRDVLDSNSLLLNEIMDSMREGKVTEKVLQIYELEDGLYGISLFTIYSSLTPMKTYDSEQLGTGTLDDVVDKMIELAHEIPISQMIVKREIGREINAAVMKRALKMMAEEERKRGEYL